MAKLTPKQIIEEIRTIRHVHIQHLVSDEVRRFITENFEIDRTHLASPDSLSEWFQVYQEENKPSADFVREIELALSSIHDLPPDVFVSFDFWLVD